MAFGEFVFPFFFSFILVEGVYLVLGAQYKGNDPKSSRSVLEVRICLASNVRILQSA